MDLLIFISASIIADAILIQNGPHFAHGQKHAAPIDFNMRTRTRNDKRIQPNATNCFMNRNKPV